MIHIDHILLPARDCEACGRFFAQVFGLEYTGLNVRGQAELTVSPTFMVVYTKTESPISLHAGFHVDQAVVDRAKRQLDSLGVKYGGHPASPDDSSDDHYYGGKGFYFCDPQGHKLEMFTVRKQH